MSGGWHWLPAETLAAERLAVLGTSAYPQHEPVLRELVSAAGSPPGAEGGENEALL